MTNTRGNKITKKAGFDFKKKITKSKQKELCNKGQMERNVKENPYRNKM